LVLKGPQLNHFNPNPKVNFLFSLLQPKQYIIGNIRPYNIKLSEYLHGNKKKAKLSADYQKGVLTTSGQSFCGIVALQLQSAAFGQHTPHERKTPYYSP